MPARKGNDKLIEGKTKILYAVDGSSAETFIQLKDDITAGDGARHNVISGLGRSSNATNAHCFQLLNRRGIPTHFLEVAGPRAFRAHRVTMIPLEVVTRRIATGSYGKRQGVAEGMRFDELIVEFYLKDDARHDPLVVCDSFGRRLLLFEAGKPASAGAIEERPIETIQGGARCFDHLARLARATFEILEEVWALAGITLVDLKVEGGYLVGEPRRMVLADSITNGEWRIWPDGDSAKRLDKDVYRKLRIVTPRDLVTIRDNYRKVADLTETFSAL